MSDFDAIRVGGDKYHYWPLTIVVALLLISLAGWILWNAPVATEIINPQARLPYSMAVISYNAFGFGRVTVVTTAYTDTAYIRKYPDGKVWLEYTDGGLGTVSLPTAVFGRRGGRYYDPYPVTRYILKRDDKIVQELRP